MLLLLSYNEDSKAEELSNLIKITQLSAAQNWDWSPDSVLGVLFCIDGQDNQLFSPLPSGPPVQFHTSAHDAASVFLGHFYPSALLLLTNLDEQTSPCFTTKGNDSLLYEQPLPKSAQSGT